MMSQFKSVIVQTLYLGEALLFLVAFLCYHGLSVFRSVQMQIMTVQFTYIGIGVIMSVVESILLTPV